ncbi:hypothetical protein ACFQZE_23120 [Paenibacillus sp. GCM10027627]|uniref:hypothetical protein n=1 Tax=unclassified Paenibacillus TaxID=185978 RepID=UPI0036305B8E
MDSQRGQPSFESIAAKQIWFAINQRMGLQVVQSIQTEICTWEPCSELPSHQLQWL